MSCGITNNCFPPAIRCINCQRKGHDQSSARLGITGKEYKRCTQCRLMTYCDRDCQREHWNKIHKDHCRFLSGKKVKNSDHNPEDCGQCIEAKQSSEAEIFSFNSPKMFCCIEMITQWMKIGMGKLFDFHAEGRTCACPAGSSWQGQLPFALGEVSWSYLGEGHDEMLAHALKLAMAVHGKDSMGNVREETISLIVMMRNARVGLWTDFLVFGKVLRSFTFNNQALAMNLENLKRYLGYRNPWWIALKHSLDVLASIEKNDNAIKRANPKDKCKDESKFSLLKTVFDYKASQNKNAIIASKSGLLPKFKPWPKLVSGSLEIHLPNDLHCQTCGDRVEGQFSMQDEEVPLRKLYPQWLPDFGENGSCLVFCSLGKKPNCVNEGLKKNPSQTMDEEQWKKYTEEMTQFLKKSRICDECGGRSISSHRCSGCHAVQYCSTECLKKDGEFHKTVCDNWAKDETKTLGSAREQKDYWKSVAEGAKKKYE